MATETSVTVRPESIERGAFVRAFRRLHCVELTDLAKRVDLSHTMLSLFERGERNLSGEAWKRVLIAINAIVNENAEALGAQFQKLSDEWMDLFFFPTLRSAWTPDDIAEALSNPSRLSIVEKQQKETMAALEVWETVQKLIPEAEAEQEAELLASPQECLQRLKEMKAAYKSLLDAVELQNKKLANLEASGYVIVPKIIVEQRDELRAQNAKLLDDLRVLRGEG